MKIGLLGCVYIALLFSSTCSAKDYIIDGKINEETFIRFQNEVSESFGSLGNEKLIINSPGGEIFSAMAIAKLVRERNMDVEVRSLCASACANYIFPSGRKKYLGSDAVIILHGGLQQRNLRSQMLSLSKEKLNTVGREGKEGYANFVEQLDEKQILVRRYIKVPADCKINSLQKNADCFSKRYAKFERDFYRDLGIDPNYTSIGQVGTYKIFYESYRYEGFTYSLSMFRSLGIANIAYEGVDYPGRNLIQDYNIYLVDSR